MGLRIIIACAVALLFALLATGASADPRFGFAPGTQLSLSSMQAGAHADLTTSFALNSYNNPADPTDPLNGSPYGDLRDVKVSLPPGFWGAPTGFATCTEAEVSFNGMCKATAQVGEIYAKFFVAGPNFIYDSGPWPIYNMPHSDDLAAQFGASLGLNTFLRVKVRSDDFGLDTMSMSIPSTLLRVAGIRVVLWGVPADHNNSGDTRRPFMTNPASCDGPLQGSISMDQWDARDVWVTDAAPLVPQGSPAGTPASSLTGCDRMPQLKPQLTAGPVGTAADTPSGYDIDMKVPQSDNPDGIATPTVKALSVAFPEGVAISPAAADGLQACTDAQLAPGTDAEPSCPDASKVGTVSIATPALADPLEGAMYLGEPQPGHPYRLFLVAKGTGVLLKLRGEAHADASTGQITTTFDNTPALPFSALHVHLKSGSRALLANPIACGTYTSTATLTPYGGGAPGVATSDFGISADGNGSACAQPTAFAPSLSAGVTNPVAGASSPFTFRLTRDDRQRELGSITSVHLPAGLIADVSDVPLCSGAAAAAAACSAASRIGDVRVGSGAGEHPLYLPGSVFLTGPYKGAPFGLSIVVPAIAGPYDLGTVNVRAAVKVNPDASLSVEADPLPTILQGIPLRLRDIVLDLNRSGFMRNPTSCAPATITASAVSVDGLAAPLSNRFQVGDCAALGYHPSIHVALSGREKSGSTGLTAHVVTRSGDANSRRISVKLPRGVGLNVDNTAGICTAAQFDARDCPKSSVVGSAKVDSILHEPLTGPVHFVQGAAGGKAGTALPRLFIPLKGDGVTIDLVAQTAVENGRIVTTFDGIPDVPFSTFDLKINGGPTSILAMAREACSSTPTAAIEMDGYNGKLSDGTLVVPAGCPLRVLSRRVSVKRVTLKVSGLSAGVLRVSGPGIRSAKRTIRSATVASISATRTGAPARVTVTFDPAGPAKARSIRVNLRTKR